MAGFYFGTSRWDDIPQKLGLHVEGGVLNGLWNGRTPVRAQFGNHYVPPFGSRDGYYEYRTYIEARFDPPLLMGAGLESVRGVEPEYAAFVLDPRILAEANARLKPLGLALSVSDERLAAVWSHYEEKAESFRSAFDTLAAAAEIIAERRAANPARWELALRASWPKVASGWRFAFDARRGEIKGEVRGRHVVARPAIHEAHLVTQVLVDVPLPPDVKLSLSRQDGDGFFRRLFRGQDIKVGDAELDAAFVIKGKPEEHVKALVGRARGYLLAMLRSGDAIELADGVMTVWSPELTAQGRDLDTLLKLAFGAADALFHV